MKVHFYLDRRKGRTGELPVFLNFWHGGTLLRMYAGVQCDPALWDGKKERADRKHKMAAGINSVLDAMESDLLKYVYRAKKAGKPIDLADLRKQMNRPGRGQEEFFRAWDEFVEGHRSSKRWNENTVSAFKTLRSHLVSLSNRVELDLGRTDRDLIRSFIEYQQDLELATGYISRNVSMLRWFLHWAGIRGYLKDFTYKKYRMEHKSEEGTKRPSLWLTGQELGKMLSLNLENPVRASVRDAFCFSCLTGISHADLRDLKQKDLQHGRLRYTPRKTNTKLDIDLPDRVASILADGNKGKAGRVLRLPVLQTYNRILKEIGKQSGLDEIVATGAGKSKKEFRKWELLSSRVARNTFVQLGIQNGISLEVLTGLLGYGAGSLGKYYSTGKETSNKAMNKIGRTLPA